MGKLSQRENWDQAKEQSLSQKSEDLQQNQKELDAIRENLNVQLDLVEKRKKDWINCIRQQVEQLGNHFRTFCGRG